MSIPCKMRPAGLESLPVGYNRLEYLENPGKQWIDTEVFPTKDTDFYVHFIIPAYTSSGFKVIFSAYIDGNYDIVYSNPNGQNPMLIRVPNGSATTGLGTGWFKWYPGQRYIVQKEGYELFLNGELKASRPGIREFEATTTLALLVARYPNIDNNSFNRTKLFSFVLSQQNTPLRNFIPALDPSGRPCMFDTVTRRPFHNQGTGEFIAGMTAKQACELAYLPATGGSLTISLPLEAAFDEKVQNALSAATEKGWIITVQYRESDLTTENIEADFLESTATQYIDTGKTLLADTQVKSRFQQTKFEDSDWQAASWLFGVGKSGAAEHLLFGLWRGILHPTQSGYMIQGEYGGGFQNITDSINVREPLILEMSRELVTLNAEELYYVSSAKFDIGDEVLSYPIFDGIGSNGTLGRRSYLRIWYFVDTTPSEEGLRLSLIPVLDSTGTPCMYDTVSGQNFYNANTEEGATPFTVGFDTTEKAAISLSKLPITTAGELTVSLPAAAQDESSLVPEAINIATKRGWTIITQYREA